MFFQYISQVLSPGVDLSLTISKTAAGLTVILMPRVNGLQDPAQNKIVPLTLKGAPQELDAKFFPSITQPVQKTSGLLLNMAAYEKQLEAAAAASKAEKDKKDKESKEAKEKRDKYDGFIKKADELEAAGDNAGAITQLQQARLHATDKQKKSVDEKLTKLRTVDLFDAPVAQPTATQTAPVQAPVEQVAAQPSAEIQPNVQDFGIFSQPAGASATMVPDTSFMPETDPIACRDNEYEGYPDFPLEMQPPMFSGAPN